MKSIATLALALLVAAAPAAAADEKFPFLPLPAHHRDGQARGLDGLRGPERLHGLPP